MFRFLPAGILACYLTIITGCIEIKEEIPAMFPGEYRGVFLLDKNPYKYYDEQSPARQETIFLGISDVEVPFNFRVDYNQAQEPYITLYTDGKEIKVTDISYGIDRSTSHDTVRIDFKEHNSYIFAEYAENIMQGYYRDLDKPKIKIPFNAEYGRSYRFSQMPEEAKIDLNGSWDILFEEDSTASITVKFEQDGNHLLGWFAGEALTVEQLEGIVEGDKLWLSSFDGKHIYLFYGKALKIGELQGFLKTGKSKIQAWEATKIVPNK